MDSTNRSLLIACIKCGSPSRAVLDTNGEYADILVDMLETLAATLPEWKATETSYLSFDAVEGKLPAWGSIDGYNAVFITGSNYSAFDSHPWIRKLRSFIQAVYKDKPSIRLFGSCFGHQLICQSLFKLSDKDSPLPQPPYAVVSRNPKGWELGVQPIKLSEEFTAQFGPVVSNPDCDSTMRLRLIHQDHVDPKSLPNSFINVGRRTPYMLIK